MFARRRKQNPDTESDKELCEALSSDGERAMAAIYRRHGGLVYRFAMRLSQDQSVAEDVTQEVFLALLKRNEGFDSSRASLSTWLCAIARNQIWKHLERSRRQLLAEPFEDAFEASCSDDDPGIALTRREGIAAVQRGIDDLPAVFKEVVILCELEEMTYEEASAVIGVPVGTVRSRLHRAKGRLALLLGDNAAMRSPGNKR